MDLAEAELLSPGLEQRHAEQASIRERLTGGDGQTLWNILGLSITDMRGLSRDVRRTVNYLRNGATVREVIHEKTHGFRREARARGRLTRDDEVAFIRAYDSITRGKQTRGMDGGHVSLAFLPDGIADTEITDTMLDEAISEIMEVELMRMARHGSRRGQADSARARGIGTSGRVTVKNITAALKLLSPAAAQRFSHFMQAARSYFGIVFGRTAAINKAERDGKFDREGADAFIDKLFGLHREGSPDVTNSDPAEASDATESAVAFSLGSSIASGIQPIIGEKATDSIIPLGTQKERELQVHTNPSSKRVSPPDGGFSANLLLTRAQSRSGHSRAGNKQLHEAMEADPALRAKIQAMFGEDAMERTSLDHGGRRNPEGAEWDHNSIDPNALDLRSKQNHLQKTRREGRAGGGWKRFRKKGS
ncbi:hypothetical protein [Luteolibacter luteus]|uniref:Uncharacterized protein n=1 Tax=Luteolibacter luteus TaxID=2728835 RepID=A0A858RNX7_9BACT|nr:hypothetical protein [Luteolibacter luteus]QJE99146.1 hypothetical protein HHL09_26315 [Luteolibacter luteus]